MSLRRSHLVFLAAFAVSIASADDRTANADQPAVLLDRIVAVVDDKTIYRSDVIARASPFLARVVDKNAGTMTKLYREVLDTMIDELIIAAQNELIHLHVTDEEIELAIDTIAKTQNISRKDLAAEVKKQHMSMDEYRAEMRRQLLDAKWVQLRVRPRVKPITTGTDEEKERAFYTAVEVERRKVLTQLKTTMFVDVRW